MNNLTEKTNSLVNRWVAAKKNLKKAEEALNSAKGEVANVTNDLGEWLSPEDQPVGEVFNIWFGSGIIQVKKTSFNRDYEVSWRREPDAKDRQEYGI